jgi:hypothetical protein
MAGFFIARAGDFLACGRMKTRIHDARNYFLFQP